MARDIKNISVTGDDHAEYEEIAAMLAKKVGLNISIPQAVRKAMDLLKKDLEEDDEE
jgi:uncharacterized protein (UPF0147 family)